MYYRNADLQGIVRYHQGTNDGLCVYYSACTVLATLVPALRESLGVGRRVQRAGFTTKDPLLELFAKQEDGERYTSVARALADWFFEGKTLEAIKPKMNKIVRAEMGCSSGFRYLPSKGSRPAKKREELVRSIDSGLPALLAWNSRDYGNHWVTVSGYSIDTKKKSTWFTLADPGRTDRMSWEGLLNTATDVEILLPSEPAFPRLRPDKHVWREDPDFVISDRQEWRWWPSGEGGCRWQLIEALFEAAQKQRA